MGAWVIFPLCCTCARRRAGQPPSLWWPGWRTFRLCAMRHAPGVAPHRRRPYEPLIGIALFALRGALESARQSGRIAACLLGHAGAGGLVGLGAAGGPGACGPAARREPGAPVYLLGPLAARPSGANPVASSRAAPSRAAGAGLLAAADHAGWGDFRLVCAPGAGGGRA